MAPQLKYAGDPRRPSEKTIYSAELFTPEDFPPDAFILFGLTFGMAAMMMKFKWAALISITCSLVSIANSRGTENDIKQIVSTLCVAGFALFQTYVDLPVNTRPTE